MLHLLNHTLHRLSRCAIYSYVEASYRHRHRRVIARLRSGNFHDLEV